MKIRVSHLRKIIAEEVRRVLSEAEEGVVLAITNLEFTADPNSDSGGFYADIEGSYDGQDFSLTADNREAPRWDAIQTFSTSPDEDFLTRIAESIEGSLGLEPGSIDWRSVNVPGPMWKNFMNDHDDFKASL